MPLQAMHDDLLELARELVGRNPAASVQADLRRGVSTAYYALFHLLVHEATTRLVAIESLRSRVARSFDHRVMKAVCQDYSQGKGVAVPQKIRDIAEEFIALQLARVEADYDTSAIIKQSDADTDVMRAESAFLDWAAVRTDPAASDFLAELFCRGIPKR